MNSKTVLITGASRGIGKATAELFAREGYGLILNYNNSKEKALKLSERLTKTGSKVLVYQADVSKQQQVENMVSAGESFFGGIDILICNAGISQQQLFTEITPDEWRKMMSVTVDAAFYCCRAVLPGMIRRKKGKIVLISSIWGIVGASCEVHYSTAKAALIGMTKALAKELGPSNIQVNCVAPGIIDTDMNSTLDIKTRRELISETPMGRMGSPYEVAESIVFLSSDKADFITGQVLSPNGGFVI
ncbi:MAG: 3-oxoacyl-ACP reductase FabG [Oscillospiraceae bacterium]|jgi:3-oxoacyl-[acyl-carrier protein] reductase|nr:3-oxoacyl-ACP reductase FabG [Oscillospiraceae bacterium]